MARRSISRRRERFIIINARGCERFAWGDGSFIFPADKEWGKHIAAEDNIDIDAPLLFGLATDLGERNNVAHDNPEVVARLLEQAEKAREDIGDYDRVGSGARFFDPDPRRPDLAQSNIRR